MFLRKWHSTHAFYFLISPVFLILFIIYINGSFRWIQRNEYFVVTENILSYSWEIWTLNYKLRKNVKYRNWFLERSWKNLQSTKSNKWIREKIGVKIILEREENNMLEWYGHAVGMEASRWLRRMITRSPEGRRRWGRTDEKWGKEVERVMK